MVFPERQASGIYLLISKGTVVYVGMTSSLAVRIGAHAVNKDFDKVVFYECAEEQKRDMEVSFINMYKPKYNSCYPQLCRDEIEEDWMSYYSIKDTDHDCSDNVLPRSKEKEDEREMQGL